LKDYTKNSVLDWTDDTEITTITPAIIDKSKFIYVQEMGVMHAFPTFYTKRENLPSYLLVYTEGGRACLRYHNREYHLVPGDAFFIYCMEYQHYFVESKENWDCRFVHIYGPGAIRQYYDIFVRSTGYVIHLPSTSKVPMYITRIIECYKPRHKNSDLIAAMHIIQLLTEIVLNAESAANYEHANYVQDVAQYIDENYDQDLSLEVLAEKFNVTKSYLPRQFKAQMGLTPTEYLTQVRIQAAKEILRKSNTPIHEVAKMVGVDNISYFIKLFKKYEQLTPHAYRNKWSGKDSPVPLFKASESK
jgi:AraC-like DNA-binding protein